MNSVVLSPPITMVLLVFVGLGLSYFAATLAAPGHASDRKFESYACGQRDIDHNVSPDYGQFFPFAFFFTIMHVLVLIVATAPKGALTLPLLYVATGVLALLILFRN